jgi:hypothetical protein
MGMTSHFATVKSARGVFVATIDTDDRFFLWRNANESESTNLKIEGTILRTAKLNNSFASSLASMGGSYKSCGREVGDFESVDDFTVVDNDLDDFLDLLRSGETTDCNEVISLVSGNFKDSAHY